MGELDRALIAQTTEAEVLARRVEELNARRQELDRLVEGRLRFGQDLLSPLCDSGKGHPALVKGTKAGLDDRFRKWPQRRHDDGRDHCSADADRKTRDDPAALEHVFQ